MMDREGKGEGEEGEELSKIVQSTSDFQQTFL